MKRWSKLQTRIYSMIDPKVPFQIHYIAYPMRSQRGSTSIPRCYITIDKEIIWYESHTRVRETNGPAAASMANIGETSTP